MSSHMYDTRRVIIELMGQPQAGLDREALLTQLVGE